MADIEYATEYEGWSKYVLPDGSSIKVRLIVTGIETCYPPKYDDNGIEQYQIHCQQVMQFTPSDQARKNAETRKWAQGINLLMQKGNPSDEQE
jgi:hypothetical protein